MARRWLWVLSAVCLSFAGCDKHPAKKPDPTKGAVTGIVLCADTGKPARFATVTLSAAPTTDSGKEEKGEQSGPLPATESAVTDLDGRFRIEAVEPGRYYAFATLNGYLNPMRGLDFARIEKLSNDREQELDAIKQWKDHLVELSVMAHRTADLSLQVERGAEIGGTVTFDDGSPAIGMHFQLYRKTEKDNWTEVGPMFLSDLSGSEASDGHGHYNLVNLPAGEYALCALMPSDSDESAARVCLGGVFRRKEAGTVKVQSGEIAGGADITIPLSGLHTVAGTVTALADGHPLSHATVRLLYADDREKARQISALEDGSFSLQYVAEGNYILSVTGAQDADQKSPDSGAGGSDAATPKASIVRSYADKEVPLNVIGDMDDLQVQLVPVVPPKLQNQ